jgi:hypothetical protein
VSCARREAGVAAVLGAPPPLISSVARMSAATSGVVVHPAYGCAHAATC